MQYEKLPRRSLVIWEIASVVLYAVLFWLIWNLIPSYTVVWYVVLWLIGALSLLTAVLYLPLLYLNIGYAIKKDQVVLTSGVFVHKNYVMRRDRISFVTRYTTPLDRFLRVSGVVLSAPGSQLMLLFIDSERAKQIVERINQGMMRFNREAKPDTLSNQATKGI